MKLPWKIMEIVSGGIPRVSGGEPIPINTEAVNIRIPRVGGGEPGDAGTAKTFLTYSPRGRG